MFAFANPPPGGINKYVCCQLDRLPRQMQTQISGGSSCRILRPPHLRLAINVPPGFAFPGKHRAGVHHPLTPAQQQQPQCTAPNPKSRLPADSPN
jgi:hypothetical protein